MRKELNFDLFYHFLDVWLPQADRLAKGFEEAKPFPHIVLDDFLPRAGADFILEHFPSPTCRSFGQPDNKFQVRKLGQIQKNYFRGVPQTLRYLLHDFNSMAFVEFIERLTGIRGIIPDPHFHGGAFHQSLPGGHLGIHADFNVDRRRRLLRRVNVLIYFNKHWKSGYGGDLELWDTSLIQCEQRIEPIFNRCVIFETSSNSYHGHPVPIAENAPENRKSLALYYYAADQRAFDPGFAHSTIWKDE